jgi:hypothetical protein
VKSSLYLDLFIEHYKARALDFRRSDTITSSSGWVVASAPSRGSALFAERSPAN